jgi:hypothetical protein
MTSQDIKTVSDDFKPETQKEDSGILEAGFQDERYNNASQVRGSSSGRYYATSGQHVSGDITVTSCPFAPTRITMTSKYSTGSGSSNSYGTYDGTNYNCITAAGGGDWIQATDRVLHLYNGSGTTVKRATVSSLTSNGCVITFSVSSGTVGYLIEFFA